MKNIIKGILLNSLFDDGNNELLYTMLRGPFQRDFPQALCIQWQDC